MSSLFQISSPVYADLTSTKNIFVHALSFIGPNAKHDVQVQRRQMIRRFFRADRRGNLVIVTRSVINPVFPRLLVCARAFLHCSIVPYYLMQHPQHTGFYASKYEIRQNSRHANALIRLLMDHCSTAQFSSNFCMTSAPVRPKYIRRFLHRLTFFASNPYFTRTLSFLSLNGECLSDDNVVFITALKSLKKLHIQDCFLLTEKGFAEIGKLTNIEEFYVEGLKKFFTRAIFPITAKTEDDLPISVKVFFEVLANMPYLRKLIVGHNVICFQKEFDQVLARKFVRNNIRLEEFETRISAALGTISFLEGLPNLRLLNIQSSKESFLHFPAVASSFAETISSVGGSLQHFAFGESQSLQTLSGIFPPPSCSSSVPSLPALRSLSFSGSYKLMDVSSLSHHLATNRSLTSLSLSHCRSISVSSLKGLFSSEDCFPFLKVLKLHELPAATDPDVVEALLSNSAMQKNMTELILGTSIDDTPPSVLVQAAKFVNLEKLILGFMRFTEEDEEVYLRPLKGEFSYLKVLSLFQQPPVNVWPRQKIDYLSYFTSHNIEKLGVAYSDSFTVTDLQGFAARQPHLREIYIRDPWSSGFASEDKIKEFETKYNLVFKYHQQLVNDA